MQDFTTVTTIIVIANGLTAIVSVALVMLIFWQDPRNRVNQLFSLSMLGLFLYSLFNIITRFHLTLDLDIYFMTYLTGTLYYVFVASLFFAVTEFGQMQGQYLKLLRLYFGLTFIFLMVATWFELSTESITQIEGERGSYQAELTPIGNILALVSVSYPLITTIVLYNARKQAARLRSLWISPLMILLGVFWLATFWQSTSFPMNAILLAISALILGRAILSENLFTPLVEVSHELQEKNIQLLEADQIKNQFLSKMSHELRTPLNSIIGYTDLILDGIYGDLTDKQTDRLEKVLRNGENLLNLINDILDLSNIDIGQLTLNPEIIDTEDTIPQITSIFRDQAEEKSLEFIEHYDDLPQIFVDEVRLKQIFANILSNAIKFTDEGHVKVTATSRDNMVEFSIEDTGIGIPADKVHRVFQEFRQIDNTTTREYGGTGLGMSITKRLVEMSGGAIWLESEINKGTTFYFTLPQVHRRNTQKSTYKTAEAPSNENKITVLIIDDQHDTQIFMRDFILADKPHWEIVVAESGRDGIRRAIEYQPDVITLDIMMPSMDGWEVLKKMKADEKTQDIPVIIVSHVDHTVLADDLGAAAVIPKPVNRQKLIQKIETLAQKQDAFN